MLRLAVRVFFLLLAISAGIGLWGWHGYSSAVPMSAERVAVKLAPGTSVRAIARALRAAGADVNEWVFLAAARLDGSSLRAGHYEFERGLSLRGMMDRMRQGKTVKERFTLVEGWTMRDLRAALAAVPDLKPDAAPLDDGALLKLIGAAETHPEGLFAPDTYLFDAGSSALDLLRQAYRAQTATLRAAWESRAPDLPYDSPYEALIMASIIEKETGQAADRARIAGVFVNRLRRGMLLQTDPTVIYGQGAAFDGNLRKRDLGADHAYNTYTRPGLPPTPIALPGRASIEAALHPLATGELYFVARGDGGSEFSTTLEQHNRAVAKYQLKRGK
jgi:UPF0755 protein